MLQRLRLPTDSGPELSSQQEEFLRDYAPPSVTDELDAPVNQSHRLHDMEHMRGTYDVFTQVIGAMSDQEANEYRLSDENDRQGLYDQAVFNHFAPVAMRDAYNRAVKQNNPQQAQKVRSGFQQFWENSEVADKLDYLGGVDQERHFQFESYTQHQQALRREQQRQQQVQKVAPKVDPDRILDPQAEIEQLYGDVHGLFEDEVNLRGDEIVKRGVEKESKLFGKTPMDQHVKEKVSDFESLLTDPKDKHNKGSKQIFKGKAAVDEAFLKGGVSNNDAQMGLLDVSSRRSMDKYADKQAQSLLEGLDGDQDVEQLHSYAKSLIKLQALQSQQARLQSAQQGKHIEDESMGSIEQGIVDSINGNLTQTLKTRIQQKRSELPQQAKVKGMGQEIE